MGTWGLGPFDNDAAADFLLALSESEKPSEEIVAALEAVATASKEQYLDVDEGQTCVAACELIVLASGTEKVPKKLAALVDDLRGKSELLPLALKALPRVFDKKNSELAGLLPTAEPFEALYERLLAAQDKDAEPGAVLDIAALFKEPSKKPSKKPAPRPYETEPYDMGIILDSSLRRRVEAHGDTWALLVNGVLNFYGQLSDDIVEKLARRKVSLVQFGRRFKVSGHTLNTLDRLFAKHPDARLGLVLNGFGAFDDLDFVSQLPSLRALNVGGSPAFMTETANEILARFPQLNVVVMEGVETRRR